MLRVIAVNKQSDKKQLEVIFNVFSLLKLDRIPSTMPSKRTAEFHYKL